MRYFLLICCFFFFSSFENGSNEILRLKYDILQNGQKIGEIRAKKSIIDGQTDYSLESEMNIKVVVKQLVSYNEQAIYKDGILQKSLFKSYVNNKMHKYCKITWNGSDYEIKKDYEISYHNKSISYSGIMLYFKEPFGITYTFSEMTGSYNKMNRIGEHEYTLTDSQSKKVNKYWYKDGLLSRAYINHTLIDLELKRVY